MLELGRARFAIPGRMRVAEDEHWMCVVDWRLSDWSRILVVLADTSSGELSFHSASPFHTTFTPRKIVAVHSVSHSQEVGKGKDFLTHTTTPHPIPKMQSCRSKIS